MHDAISVEKVAIVLAAGLASGDGANVAACIAAGLHNEQASWAGRTLVDRDGFASSASSHLPIVVLEADEERMSGLLQRMVATPRPEGGTVTLFPAYAKDIHSAEAYWQRHGTLSHCNESMFGIGVAGPKRWVNRLVGSLPLKR
ncbi:DUF2000 domain-containing protein [Propionivibrio soli]|uniref:DUF2000 domain-containing protein n=1 Tax=Propionivibrio soli TaxID=2976531 RepID=UPI0021E994BA|nr:DUF2000 domain-containing protein [Propionivibrio soli]